MTELEFYRELYKSADNGYDAVSALMPKTENEKLRHDMALHMDGYRYFARVAQEKLNVAHEDAKKENFLRTMPAKIGVAMSTAWNHSSEHMAEMMINGSNMGVLEMTKNLNRLKEANASEEACETCQNMINFEQDNIKRMKKYV